MGGCCGRQKEVKTVLIGLDQSGKTTLLNALKHGNGGETKPTVGFNFETVTHQGVDLNIWDTGGQDKIRDLWKHYYEEVDGICFVVDVNSTDERFQEAKDSLHKALRDINLKDAFLCVVGNKIDKVEGGVNGDVITQKLELNALPGNPGRKRELVFLSATKLTNLNSLLDWLAAQERNPSS